MKNALHSFAICALILATNVVAQSQSPNSSSKDPHFQSNVGVVLVDAVVTDAKDQPVLGLEKKDFEIFEDGKPQTIAAFEAHKASRAKPPKLPPMPPGVYTNFPVATSDAVNVLLLDTLNTQVEDQSYVRAQLIRYLKAVPPGTRLAVFVLTTQLRIIQAVTADSSVLLAALNNPALGSAPQQSPMLLTDTEADSDAVMNREMTVNLTFETGTAMNAMMHRGIAYMKEFKLNFRIQSTLLALQQMSRYLADFPGRKNLIWFSGSFPIGVFPDLKAPDMFEATREYGGEVQKTAELLAKAQVAIYPIGAEGMVWDKEYEANADEIGGSRALDNTPTFTNTSQINMNHISMEVLAENSGGKAFYNTNGLSDALAQAINYGSNYYTLTYRTTNKKMDGRYRRIQLKLVDSKYKLAYRRGYYADNPKDEKTKDQKTDPLMPLMKRGLPDMAQILYKMKVAPVSPQPDAAFAGDQKDAKGPFTRYSVDFAINIDDLSFATTPDGSRNGDIEMMLVAYDQEGKPLNFMLRKRALYLKSENYAAAQTGGLQLHYEIDVPQGALSKNQVYLRAGICDPRTTNAGTLEVPLHPVAVAALTSK